MSMPSFRIRRLPARYGAVVMPLVLSVMMTFIVSAVSTLRSVGPVPDFLRIWMGAWSLSWVVAFPALLMVLPVVRRVVGWIVAPA